VVYKSESMALEYRLFDRCLEIFIGICEPQPFAYVVGSQMTGNWLRREGFAMIVDVDLL
jgi:hypothetical protein